MEDIERRRKIGGPVSLYIQWAEFEMALEFV